MTPCDHQKFGDFIHGMWVCGVCYKPLESRPVTYGMASRLGGKGERQVITWIAPVAYTDDGVSLSKFVGWMVTHLRLKSRWAYTKDDARKECLTVLQEMGEPFGSKHASWTRADAKDLVVEGICSYWDGIAAANI